MLRTLVAIAAIWIFATIAWCILGATVLARTQSSQDALYERVGSTWGTTQRQRAPDMSTDVKKKSLALPLTRTRADVDLDLGYRQKGLLWYSTYRVAFRGDYLFANDGPQRLVTLHVPFPAQQAIYDDFAVLVNGRSVPVVNDGSGATFSLTAGAGAQLPVSVTYRSHGLDSWVYDFGDKVTAVHDFALRMHTNFAAIDFPVDTVSPTGEVRSADGWNLHWTYRNLVSGYSIGMTMPQMMQPGPLAQRLSFWAPVALLFFFLVMFVITTLRSVDLHPMNYAFLAGAFFAFHLLFAYTVDHISIPLAFTICSAVSLFLVVSYLRLVTGLRFAAFEAGGAQLVYLILFSLALFNEGWSGLTITIGAIITLFIIMQMTGRVRWATLFAPTPRPFGPAP